jgi:hypothetical protein
VDAAGLASQVAPAEIPGAIRSARLRALEATLEVPA